MTASGEQHPVSEAARQAPGEVIDFIREAIFTGEFAPGAALRQDAIARRFNISKVPVREALKQLEAEGVVVFHANKGAVVRRYSAEEVREIGEVSAILEARMIRLSIPRMTFADHNRLEELLAMIEAEQDSKKWFDLDVQFRVELMRRAERPFMTQMLDRFVNNRALHASVLRMPTREKTLRDYRVALDAARSNDAEVAAAVMYANMLRISNEVYRHLKAQGG